MRPSADGEVGQGGILKQLRFNIFGTLIGITRSDEGWRAFYLGADGKRRPADFVVPVDVAEDELCEYLADLYHENATPRNSTAVQLA
jgi:hypothetical protein